MNAPWFAHRHLLRFHASHDRRSHGRKKSGRRSLSAHNRSETEIASKANDLGRRREWPRNSGTNNEEMLEMAQFMHGDQAAQVLSTEDFDAADGVVMFRGVNDPGHVSDNIEGRWVGHGLYGNGNYFAENDLDAQPYAGQNGWVYRAKLRSDARVIDADAAYDMQDFSRRALSGSSPGAPRWRARGSPPR